MALPTILTMIACAGPNDPVSHVTRAVNRAGIVNNTATDQGTYFIATELMKFSDWLLSLFGWEKDETLFTWVYIAIVFLLAMVVGIGMKWLVVFILDKLKPHVKSKIYTNLVEKRFFIKVSRILPAVLFLILIQFTLFMHTSIASWLTRLTAIYITTVVAVALCSLSDVIWVTLDQRENKKKLPLDGIIQVVKLLVWIIAIIVIAAILLDKSPGALLAGLGAFAAVLMLIFKDSILGIVAGVQLAQNDSLHVGDWIAVPGNNANGIVAEVTLTDVKIINWDKTVSTVPPYTLISSGFTNYRNMQESQTRRIQRSYNIDADSVVEATEELLAEFSQVELIKDWIAKKQAQKAAGKVEDVNNSEGLVDGSIDTNLGIFRAYVKLYLNQNNHVSHDDDCFVTTLAQTVSGIPLQIYCFTNTSAWFAYEGIQASIFEHLAVMLHKFHLYTFENASGRDTIIEGSLSAGRTTGPIVGIPYPYYFNSGTPMQPGTPPPGLYPQSQGNSQQTGTSQTPSQSQ